MMGPVIALLLVLTACDAGPRGPKDSLAVCDSEVEGDTGIQVGVIDPVCRCHTPTLEIGTGIEGYEPVEEGAFIPMVHGAQGGWHLQGAARITNTRNVVQLVAQVFDVESGQAVTTELTYRLQLVAGEACDGTVPNMILYLDTTAMADGERDTPPELLSCKEMRIVMCASDTGGREVCSEKRAIAQPDPADVESGLAQDCG